MIELGYVSLKPLGVTAEACKLMGVPQVRTPNGIKLGVKLSEGCSKILNMDGSYYWSGQYEPDMGLVGTKGIETGSKVVLVASDLEALKLTSLGVRAVCLAEPKAVDSLTLDILADQLGALTSQVIIWPETGFKKRGSALERFALHLASRGGLDLRMVRGSKAILSSSPKDLEALTGELSDPEATLRPWKPQGLQTLDEVMEDPSFNAPIVGYTTGYAGIDKSNNGIRTSEVTMFTAGSGVGKSTIVREIAYHLGLNENVKVGMIFLEEPVERTAKCLAAIRFSKPVDVIRKDPNTLTEAQWKDFRTNPKLRSNFMFHNHFGSLDSDSLFSKIEYMIDHFGAKFICLDHISIVVSGMSSKEGERKDIDILMTRMATLAVSKDVGFIAISHLSQPIGAPHEEGGRVTLSQLRGSGSIKQLSASIFALERNQQNPDSTLALVRQLKARETGNTGPIGVVNYSKTTGRLLDSPEWDPLEFEQQLNPAKGRPGGGSGKSAYGGNGNSDGFKGIKFVEPY